MVSLANRESEPPGTVEPVEDLLGAPIERTALNRFLVMGGPLGLLLAIVSSLWVSFLRVEHSALVQVEQAWVPGEQLGIRTEALDGAQVGIVGTRVDLALEVEGAEHPLGTLEPGTRDGLAQGRLQVPQVPVGPAQLRLDFQGSGLAFTERLAVELVAERPADPGTLTVSASVLQRADDTDPQVEAMPIVLRPMGRLLAGFSNRFMVRVTLPDGRPWSGPVEVVLVAGEFMGKRGKADGPPSLLKGSTDALGLLSFEGPLTSEVVRLGVRVLSAEDPNRVLHQRRFRFVSYAGVTKVDARPDAVQSAARIELHARGLGRKRPVYVDAFGPDGAFVDALDPFRSEPPREWVDPSLAPGTIQFEAYHFTNAPGESADIARVQLVSADPESPQSLKTLLDTHRRAIDETRVELGYDNALESAHLDRIAELAKRPQDVASARAWLLGTLPVRVHGPPVALSSRAREEEDLAAYKRRWTVALRWFTLGGGAAFLLLLLVLMLRSHRQAAEATLRELRRAENLGAGPEDSDEALQMRELVERGIRAALIRGLGFVAVMGAGLVLTIVLLENLLWNIP